MWGDGQGCSVEAIILRERSFALEPTGIGKPTNADEARTPHPSFLITNDGDDCYHDGYWVNLRI